MVRLIYIKKFKIEYLVLHYALLYNYKIKMFNNQSLRQSE